MDRKTKTCLVWFAGRPSREQMLVCALLAGGAGRAAGTELLSYRSLLGMVMGDNPPSKPVLHAKEIRGPTHIIYILI